MNLRKNSLNLLLALTLALASVMSAHHVHGDSRDLGNSSGDQIEQCLALHQLHFDGQAQHEHFQLADTLEIFYGANDHSSESSTHRLLPPARAPPAFS